MSRDDRQRLEDVILAATVATDLPLLEEAIGRLLDRLGPPAQGAE